MGEFNLLSGQQGFIQGDDHAMAFPIVINGGGTLFDGFYVNGILENGGVNNEYDLIDGLGGFIGINGTAGSGDKTVVIIDRRINEILSLLTIQGQGGCCW